MVLFVKGVQENIKVADMLTKWTIKQGLQYHSAQFRTYHIKTCQHALKDMILMHKNQY